MRRAIRCQQIFAEDEEVKKKYSAPRDLVRACATGDLNRVVDMIFRASELPPTHVMAHALHTACKYDNEDIVKALLEGKADPNTQIEALQNYTPLMHACSLNLKRNARLLIHFGAKLDLVNDFGYSALHLSARNDALSCVKLLSRLEADRRIRGKDGKLAVDLAAGDSRRFLLTLPEQPPSPPAPPPPDETPVEHSIAAAVHGEMAKFRLKPDFGLWT